MVTSRVRIERSVLPQDLRTTLRMTISLRGSIAQDESASTAAGTEAQGHSLSLDLEVPVKTPLANEHSPAGRVGHDRTILLHWERTFEIGGLHALS